MEIDRIESITEGFFEDMNKWKTSNQDHTIRKFKSNVLTDKEYDRANECIREMKETEDYATYKKAFDRFCYLCHIVPRGVILKKYELKRGKTDHNSLYVEYAYNTKKINLPEGIVLYHMSNVDGITELKPCFKGKAVKGFLYDKPRVYFTIRKHMPKFLADYRKPGQKVHMYICKEPIKQAYVDPLVWSNLQGAVYVETNKPIKVEQLTESNFQKIMSMFTGTQKTKEETVAQESAIDFDNFYEFVTENGFIIVED